MQDYEPPEIIKKNKNFSISEANILFILLAAVFLTVGGYVQSREIISGLIITEYGILLLPIVLYAFYSKKSLKKVFRLKGLPIVVALKIALLAAFLLPTIAVANLIAVFIIELFSNAIVMPIPTANTGVEFALLFFVIAVSAGICEEAFFRGMILNAYESELGKKWGALFSGLLFGIFHFNPQNLLGPIILGIVFSYLVQVTGSILASVIAHTANNGIAVTMGYMLNAMNKGLSGSIPDTTQGESLFQSTGILIGVIIFYAVIAVACALGVRALLRSIKKHYPRYEKLDEVLVNGKVYSIMDRIDDKLYLKPTNQIDEDIPLMTTEIEKLEQVNGKSIYKVWDREPLRINFLKLTPVLLAMIFYGYVVYIAYIRVS